MNSAGYLVEQQIKRDDIDVHVRRQKKKKKSIIAHIFLDINSVQETEPPPSQHSPHVSYISLSRRCRLGNGNYWERLGLFDGL